MVTWKEHPVPLTGQDFKLEKGDAYTSKLSQRGEKFYLYMVVVTKSNALTTYITILMIP